MIPRSVTALAIAGSLVGCSKELEPSPKVAEREAKVEKPAKALVMRRDDAQDLIDSLKTDPTPLLDRAEKAVRETLVETVGDDAAAKATINVDKSSLKTFGPKKWTVRGSLQAEDNDGNSRDTTFEVTLGIANDSINVSIVRLDI